MKTLFIGNSHTYVNDLPEIFRKICLQNKIDMEVALLCRGGIGLEDHAAEPQSRFNILFGHYDYVILQHRAHPMGDLKAMEEGAKQILSWVKEAGSVPVFYQTWAKKGDEDFQPVMSGVYEKLGEKYQVRVAPVGNEWQKMRKEHPETELFAQDGEHASVAGSTLAAQVIFETIFPQNGAEK